MLQAHSHFVWFSLCLQLVAYYNGTNKEIVWSQTEKIHWPSGGPPLDNPPCVFSTDDPSCNDGTDSPLYLTLSLTNSSARKSVLYGGKKVRIYLK